MSTSMNRAGRRTASRAARLYDRKRRATGGGPTLAELTSIEFLSASQLLDQTNDYGDATSRLGINMNGAAAKLVMPDRAGATLVPSLIQVTISSPGFTASGGATTVTRVVTLGKVLRRQASANASNQDAASGGVRTTYVSLEDEIFDAARGETIQSVVCLAGYYGAAQEGVVGTVTNSSNRAFPKPTGLFWGNIQQDRATGDFLVESGGGHAFARNGRQFACIEYYAKDAQATPNSAAMQRSATPALSTLITTTERPEVYSATIPVSALTQGDLCTVRRRVYPWIGDANAVWDDDTDAVSWPTILDCTHLRFVCDKTGGYGGAIACVKVGAPGGTVQSDIATARTTPFPTTQAAVIALVAWNNTNKGHNDHSGGSVYLMDDGAGGAVDHNLSGGMTAATAGKCWTDVLPDPANTGAVQVVLDATRITTSLIRWRVNFKTQTNTTAFLNGNVANGNVMQAFEGQTVTSAIASTAPLNYQIGLTYFRNCTLTGFNSGNSWPLGPYSTTRQQAQAKGVRAFASANLIVLATVVVGCYFKRVVFQEKTAANLDTPDGCSIINNKFMDTRATCTLGVSNGYTRGLALIQNVIERANVASSPALQIGGDSTAQAMDNIVEWLNTIPGSGGPSSNPGRANCYYTDVAAAAGVIKRGRRGFCNIYDSNMKTDTFDFALQGTGRVGNWVTRHGVGWKGNVYVIGDDQGVTSTSSTSWIGDFMPSSNTLAAGAANITYVQNNAGGAAAGDGDYHPNGVTNALYNKVPAGEQVLGWDLGAAARRTDGTGAAGAYERP